jgi:hypothetical protein
VCDDTNYASRAKGFHNEAVAAGVPAITTAGIYPGVSNGKNKQIYKITPALSMCRKFSVLFFHYCPCCLKKMKRNYVHVVANFLLL